MPKIIELTFELYINKVSCPGVWLCQDGMVNLSVFALGSRYETCMAPPVFPLPFKEIFYFRRRFQETCTLNNIFCLLKDETIYCELVQWSSICGKERSTILAQYLGALNDVLFPTNYCSIDGVDLLMRRSRKFPGILAPKIEISTKVRIDEIYEQPKELPPRGPNPNPCTCISKPEMEPGRQRSVCHTPQYHRYRCAKRHSHQSRSFIDIASKESRDSCGKPHCNFRSRTSILSSKHQERCREYHQYHVFNVTAPSEWSKAALTRYNIAECSEPDAALSLSDLQSGIIQPSDEGPRKLQLRSRLISDYNSGSENLIEKISCYVKDVVKIAPCTCDICQKYHELFHAHPLVSSHTYSHDEKYVYVSKDA